MWDKDRNPLNKKAKAHKSILQKNTLMQNCRDEGNVNLIGTCQLNI